MPGVSLSPTERPTLGAATASLSTLRTEPVSAGAWNHGDVLRRFVEAYWLRPENAFWMTLRSEALSRVEWRGPAIDLSCGDGVFSFLHHGGRFDPSFDVFQSVASLDRVTHEHADMYDCEEPGYAPPIGRRATRRVEVGTDLKRAMLSKAAALCLYDRVVQHDNNDPLPFPDASFETVYCNSAYWVERIDAFLAELRRVVSPSGHVVLHVKTADMARYTLRPWAEKLGESFLRIIGRGRLECWPSLMTRADWERRFAAAGLHIKSILPFATRAHAHLWDVGLRPLAPMLVRMANALSADTRAAIKRDWVDLMCELLSPIARADFDLSDKLDEPAELQYVLATR